MEKIKYIGVDLHTDNFVVCFFQNNKVKEKEKYPISKEGFASFKKKLSKRDRVSVEATTNASYFYDQVSPFVEKVIVVAPGKFAVIAKSTKKTDAHDAEQLAFFPSKNMLPEARLKTFTSQQLLSIVKTREILVRSRTALNNKTANILTRFGIKLTSSSLIWDCSYDKYVFCHEWEEMVEFELQTIAEEVKILNTQIKNFNNKLEEYAQDIYGYENILSISGIGPLSAVILLCLIDGIENFSNPKKLSSYFGLVPRVRESNDVRKKAPITHKGSLLGRKTLIMCTWRAIRYDGYLKNYYESMKKRYDSKGAAVATSRKLLKAIYDVLKNDWIFEDFPHYKYRPRAKKINAKK